MSASFQTARLARPPLHVAALALLLPLLCGANGAAARGFYQVEIIVIAFNEAPGAADRVQTETEERQAESFNRPAVVIDPRINPQADTDADTGTDTADAGSDDATPPATTTPAAHGQAAFRPGRMLLQEVSRLNDNPDYRVLRYLGWVQPSATREEVGKMPVQTRGDGDDDGNSDGAFHLEGAVHIYTSGPYLQTEVELRYRAPGRNDRPQPIAAPFQLALDNAPPYHLHEQRRIRLQEINYYDHPKLGVLLAVTRIAAPVIFGAEEAIALR